MHEFQIAKQALEVGLREAEQRGAKLLAVKIEIDSTSHESPEALEMAFEAAALETAAAGAKLEIERTPSQVQCPYCDHEFPGESETPTCPECGKEFIWPHHSHDVRVVAVTLDE